MAELGLPEVKLLKVIAKVKANPEIIDLVVGRKSVHEASEHLFLQVADVMSLPMKAGDQLHDWDCCRVGPLFDLISSSCPEFGKLLLYSGSTLAIVADTTMGHNRVLRRDRPRRPSAFRSPPEDHGDIH